MLAHFGNGEIESFEKVRELVDPGQLDELSSGEVGDPLKLFEVGSEAGEFVRFRVEGAGDFVGADLFAVAVNDGGFDAVTGAVTGGVVSGEKTGLFKGGFGAEESVAAVTVGHGEKDGGVVL
jgi:hypothetical protein